MAAPVGVTRSPARPSSCTSRPCISASVAGAGTGSSPWAVITRPEPSGNDDTDAVSGPYLASRRSRKMAAVTMSATLS